MKLRTLCAAVALLIMMCAPALAETGMGEIADADDMTDVIDIVDATMTPVTADMLRDGVWPVEVDTSSSMFKVTGCELTVADGAMTARLYMKSGAYTYMYPGSAEQAARTPVDDLCALNTDGDAPYFELPIEALDAGYECAAFSSRKQVWYPRTLVFRADSLPLEAWSDEYLVTADTLGLTDGKYECAVTLTGEGKAKLSSPAVLTVSGGECTAEIVFSTSKIDYAIVGGETIPPITTDGGAAFVIPVEAFDRGISIIIDFTAIKPATEVRYSVTFDSESIEALTGTQAETALADGTYTPDSFSFSGGSGKVTISCQQVELTDGEAMATIEFSSPNYTYVKLDGVQYDTTVEDGVSRVEIPVTLNREFKLTGMTTAMSSPHEVEYTLYIGLGGDGEPAGLNKTSSLELSYAEGFSVDFFEGGYALIDIKDGARYLAMPAGADAPEGLDPTVIKVPLEPERVYMAASSIMAFFARLDALSGVRFSALQADDWTIEAAAEAMRAGDIEFAGKYSDPIYELLVKGDCDLAIESTMILHTPKTQETLEALGIPVLIDRSSYESHPLGRTEWIKLYGALTGRLDEATAYFDEQAAAVEALDVAQTDGGTVAFFYINSDGSAVVRSAGDYIPRCIETAGGEYAFNALESSSSAVTISMEEFYATALNADYLIYNTSIDTSVTTLDELIARNPLLADLKAVQNGAVWRTDRALYQATDTVGGFIVELNAMLSGADEDMNYLYRLN